jgi:hypothetical protein
MILSRLTVTVCFNKEASGQSLQGTQKPNTGSKWDTIKDTLGLGLYFRCGLVNALQRNDIHLCVGGGGAGVELRPLHQSFSPFCMCVMSQDRVL